MKNKLNKYNLPDMEEILYDNSSSDLFDIEEGGSKFNVEISRTSIKIFASLVFAILLFLFASVLKLQVIEGSEYRDISLNNIFTKKSIFSERGNIYDRNNKIIATNIKSGEEGFSRRKYEGLGIGNLIGYVGYPKKDKKGVYYQDEIIGESGVEELFNETLSGDNGAIFVQSNALGTVVQDHFVEHTQNGEDVVISIDIDLQSAIYKILEEIITERQLTAGSANIIDIHTGEILSSVSYPDFDPNAFSIRDESKINEYLSNDRNFLLNRAISGLYSPGSTVKPFFAIAALEEDIISPSKIIVSNGFIRIKNPYVEDSYTYFNDWKAHGPTNLQQAIAVSSNVYFYEIGGGFKTQKGLGIGKLNQYAKIFGLEEPTHTNITNEPSGVIPNPKWKKNLFDEDWKIGDTYNTVIGQYGFQVTPLQLARATAAIANGGELIEPTISYNSDAKKSKRLALEPSSISEIKKGMRLAVTER